MVVLNIYGKIKNPICISKKLGLYIANLPEEEHNNWNDMLYEEMILAKKRIDESSKRYKLKSPFEIEKIYSAVCFPTKDKKTNNYMKIHEIVNNMIYIYLDYNYDDMPLGGWETNCFDGRMCENDYAEKIINFICSINENGNVPHYIYSSNHDFNNPYGFLQYTSEIDKYIEVLKEWGKKFDDFLISKNDYLQLDYLINAFFKDNDYNEYHFLKLYSLCQLYLDKEKEIELDKKLIIFLDDMYSEELKDIIPEKLRKMRNKIAHGDFIAFEKLVEEFACEIMDDNFYFDYSEYSRKNWVILHICCELERVVKKMINMLFLDREKLERIKNNCK